MMILMRLHGALMIEVRIYIVGNEWKNPTCVIECSVNEYLGHPGIPFLFLAIRSFPCSSPGEEGENGWNITQTEMLNLSVLTSPQEEKQVMFGGEMSGNNTKIDKHEEQIWAAHNSP